MQTGLIRRLTAARRRRASEPERRTGPVWPRPARCRLLLALASACAAAGMMPVSAGEAVPPNAAAPLGAPAATRPGAEILDALKPGEWYEVPDSHAEAVAASAKQFPWLTGSSGFGGIIACWAGGAFDTQRDQLYIGPGGGHNGYNGNEVYAFSTKEMAWRRLNDPYPVVAGGVHRSEDLALGHPHL